MQRVGVQAHGHQGHLPNGMLRQAKSAERLDESKAMRRKAKNLSQLANKYWLGIRHYDSQPILFEGDRRTCSESQGSSRATGSSRQGVSAQGKSLHCPYISLPVLSRISTQVYREFSKDYLEWLQAVKVIAELDCLVSLAKSSVALGEPAVRPEIVDEPQASVHFDELRHPCIFTPSADFIPNSVNLGGSNKDMVLLTGPNVSLFPDRQIVCPYTDHFVISDGRKIYPTAYDLCRRHPCSARLLCACKECTHLSL